MIEKIKAYWPVFMVVMGLVSNAVVFINVFICMFKSQWVEGTFWAVVYCMFQLREVKKDDRQ